MRPEEDVRSVLAQHETLWGAGPLSRQPVVSQAAVAAGTDDAGVPLSRHIEAAAEVAAARAAQARAASVPGARVPHLAELLQKRPLPPGGSYATHLQGSMAAALLASTRGRSVRGADGAPLVRDAATGQVVRTRDWEAVSSVFTNIAVKIKDGALGAVNEALGPAVDGVGGTVNSALQMGAFLQQAVSYEVSKRLVFLFGIVVMLTAVGMLASTVTVFDTVLAPVRLLIEAVKLALRTVAGPKPLPAVQVPTGDRALLELAKTAAIGQATSRTAAQIRALQLQTRRLDPRLAAAALRQGPAPGQG